MENIIQFPKEPVKADAWSEYEEVLRPQLNGVFVLNGYPQEILSVTMDRMRKIFERCADSPIDANITLSSPELSEEQCAYLKKQVEEAFAQYYPRFLRQMLTVGVLSEVVGMEIDLHFLRKAAGE